MASHVTPVRALGTRQSEGWVLLRDVGSTYQDGAEQALHERLVASEDVSLEADELSASAASWAERYHLEPARANVLRPFELAASARVLEIGAGCGAVTRYLGERCAVVDAVEPVPARARVARERCRDLPGVEVFVGQVEDVPLEEAYDAVVVVGVLEYVGGGSAEQDDYVAFLDGIARRLVPGGTLILAIENKLGVKYLVGAPEDHTNRVFDSLESYPYGSQARTFSRLELEGMVSGVGLLPRTLIAFPDYKMTRAVLAPEVPSPELRGLLQGIPSFPSPDWLSPRPRLADERMLWESFVEAGLAAETGNSFVVTATKGPTAEAVWPDGRLATYFSVGRRSGWSTRTDVVSSGAGGVAFERQRLFPGAPVSALESLELRGGTEAYVAGRELLDLGRHGTHEELVEALGAWAGIVRAFPESDDGLPIDLVPHNLKALPDGTLHAFDQEWFSSSEDLTPEDVVKRGVLWFVARLAPLTPPSRWEGCETVRDVVVLLGGAVGLDLHGAWVESCVETEARIQATVVRHSAEVAQEVLVARHVDELQGMLDGRLRDLPLGERLPDGAARTASYLAVSEESVTHLQGVTSSLQETLSGLQDSMVEADRRASESELLAARQSDRAARAELELAVLANSRGQKLIRRYYGLVERVAPPGTRRREWYGDGLRGAVSVARTVTRRRPPSALASLTPLGFPTRTAPRVSVVVPVHGKWEYTERCLRALSGTSGAVPFEVIVVDDASPDDTRARLSAVTGVRVVPLDVNQGYVGACNAGIEAARGDLVVLLNNDTRVHPDWLVPLVDALEDPTIGLAGSRLVYPDGRLQEAGGIVFDDASGWNYGKFGDPEDPRYTYRRDVDYCSGASIMLRRSTLAELGGLDTRFAPAYYDDTDLAFAVRALGLRVVYEPRSIVVHDEGVSHGTDESVGIKSYQGVNRTKFQEKWAAELAGQMPPGADDVQRAARRRQGSGIVVVVDHYVPRPDEDSGSVRMLGMLRALRDLGYGVLFVPDNRHRSEPYTGDLQRLGVEVFYGHGDLTDALLTLREDIRAIVVSRVTVARDYLIELRSALPEVPFVFDTVDLHFLREEREAALAGLEELPPRAVAMREFELAMVRSSDVTLVVSSFEQELLRGLVPDADVRVLSNVHAQVADVPPIAGREGLLFVGSFAHHPNADALRWFTAEVLPLIEERHPGIPVHVVGRDPLPELVAAAPRNVTYHGWVEDLAPVYGQVRVVIAPLRYGAGVKGKIGEAMSHGVPVVMTPVGAEGMDIRDGETALVAPAAAEFAAAVDRLVVDDVLWERLSSDARSHIDVILGTDQFAGRLKDLLGDLAAT